MTKTNIRTFWISIIPSVGNCICKKWILLPAILEITMESSQLSSASDSWAWGRSSTDQTSTEHSNMKKIKAGRWRFCPWATTVCPELNAGTAINPYMHSSIMMMMMAVMMRMYLIWQRTSHAGNSNWSWSKEILKSNFRQYGDEKQSREVESEKSSDCSWLLCWIIQWSVPTSSVVDPAPCADWWQVRRHCAPTCPYPQQIQTAGEGSDALSLQKW